MNLCTAMFTKWGSCSETNLPKITWKSNSRNTEISPMVNQQQVDISLAVSEACLHTSKQIYQCCQNNLQQNENVHSFNLSCTYYQRIINRNGSFVSLFNINVTTLTCSADFGKFKKLNIRGNLPELCVLRSGRLSTSDAASDLVCCCWHRIPAPSPIRSRWCTQPGGGPPTRQAVVVRWQATRDWRQGPAW